MTHEKFPLRPQDFIQHTDSMPLIPRYRSIDLKSSPIYHAYAFSSLVLYLYLIYIMSRVCIFVCDKFIYVAWFCVYYMKVVLSISSCCIRLLGK